MQIPSYRLPPGTRSLVETALLPWFEHAQRPMPWRENRTPYRVWVSEIMLQQTRVDTVIPYYLRWMEAFPTLQDLAAADQQTVLKHWEGLGYYSRARNLHRAAKEVVDRFGGVVPSDPDELGSLPGIGPYTRAAILSLAFGQSFAVLDGNVERVLTRICAIDGDIRSPKVKEGLRRLVTRLLGDFPPGPFNESLMELGATVCLPANPRCEVCPLAGSCRAFRSDRVTEFPYKSKTKPIPTLDVGAAITWRDEQTFLVAQRKQKGLLGGMWEFPGGKQEPGESMEACIQRELQEELGIDVMVGEHFLQVRHTYSHFHLRMQVHHCSWQGDMPQVLDCADFRWVTLKECGELPFGKADLLVVKALQENGGRRARSRGKSV